MTLPEIFLKIQDLYEKYSKTYPCSQLYYPVLKGHLFLVLSQKILYELNLLRGHLFIKPHYLCPKGDL